MLSTLFLADEPPLTPSSHPRLPCKGNQCTQCGRCRDWRYTGHPEDWQWIRGFRNWDADHVTRWRQNTYCDQFELLPNARCNRMIYYRAGHLLRFVTGYVFDGSHLLGHLCVCQ